MRKVNLTTEKADVQKLLGASVGCLGSLKMPGKTTSCRDATNSVA